MFVHSRSENEIGWTVKAKTKKMLTAKSHLQSLVRYFPTYHRNHMTKEINQFSLVLEKLQRWTMCLLLCSVPGYG